MASKCPPMTLWQPPVSAMAVCPVFGLFHVLMPVLGVHHSLRAASGDCSHCSCDSQGLEASPVLASMKETMLFRSALLCSMEAFLTMSRILAVYADRLRLHVLDILCVSLPVLTPGHVSYAGAIAAAGAGRKLKWGGWGGWGGGGSAAAASSAAAAGGGGWRGGDAAAASSMSLLSQSSIGL